MAVGEEVFSPNFFSQRGFSPNFFGFQSVVYNTELRLYFRCGIVFGVLLVCSWCASGCVFLVVRGYGVLLCVWCIS